jgi:hypothetical protein
MSSISTSTNTTSAAKQHTFDAWRTAFGIAVERCADCGALRFDGKDIRDQNGYLGLPVSDDCGQAKQQMANRKTKDKNKQP